MANREELAIIRGARAGEAACQLALGKLYLFGGPSLPCNVPTALHWLHRAALQQQAEAWMLIGRHIAFEYAQSNLPALLPWYQRASDAGVEQAGAVLAQWRQLQLPLQQEPRLEQAPLTISAHTSESGTDAEDGDSAAQLALGLWFARMDRHGRRQEDGIAAVNFKRAIRCLTLAGEQGLADAWFALSRIYMKPEFSHRCVAEAQTYLERAAELGHGEAQLEIGMYAWRNRRNDEFGDVRALYWLQKAALQGNAEAQAALERIAAAPQLSSWMAGVAPAAIRTLALRQPLLAARLALAGAFGLSRAEALLIDMAAADQGHCLVVDIRASYGRSKRRLILLRTARERRLLNDIRRQFEQAGELGMEGNYRQRLYRLKTWLPSLRDEELLAA